MTVRVFYNIAVEFQRDEPLIPVVVTFLSVLICGAIVGINEGIHQRKKLLLITSLVILAATYFGVGFVLHGTYLDFDRSTKEGNVTSHIKMYVLSVDTEIARCRRVYITRSLRKLGLDYTLVIGPSAASLNTTREIVNAAGTPEINAELYDAYARNASLSLDGGHMMVSVYARKVLLDAYKLDRAHPWILLFEDDAEIDQDFPHLVSRAIARFAEYDMVWLDNRNALSWALFREPVGGTVGIVIRRESIPKVAEEMRIDGKTTFDLITNRGWLPQYDVTLTKVCTEGKFLCGVAPIVREAKVPSSISP